MTLLMVSLFGTFMGVFAVAAALRLSRIAATITAFWVLLASQLVLESLVMGGLARALRPGPLCFAAVIVGILEVSLVRRHTSGAMTELSKQIGIALRLSATRVIRHPAVLILGLLVIGQYLWQIAQIFTLPQVSYDSLSYHLIGPTTWIQHGAIVHSPDNIFSDTYPADQELMSGWIGTFLHTLRYAGLCTVLFVAMGTSAVIMISRFVGARRSLAVLAGLGFAATPVVFLQASTAYVDVAAGSSVIAGLGFAVASRADTRMVRARIVGITGMLLLAGCAAGLAAGTKSVNVVAALLIVVIGIYQFGRARGEILAMESGVRLSRTLLPDSKADVVGGSSMIIGALVLPIIGLAVFWYLRTWVTYHSPFYPISTLGFAGLGPASQIIIGANLPTMLRHLPGGSIGQMAVSWAFDLHHHPFTLRPAAGRPWATVAAFRRPSVASGNGHLSEKQAGMASWPHRAGLGNTLRLWRGLVRPLCD